MPFLHVFIGPCDFIDFLYWYPIFNFIDFNSDFYFFFLSFFLWIFFSPFSSFLRWKLYYWFVSFFYSNTCIQCYKLPSRYCFHCIPQILINCVFIFTQLKYSLFLLKCILWHTYCLEMCFLISSVSNFFYLSFCYWFLV